ncbi:MAG: hypothetical protein ABI361_06320 [Nitrososphaera sp.]
MVGIAKARNDAFAHLPSFNRPLDILAIIFSVGFYLVLSFAMYPNIALLPGTDISRHYQSSIILSRTPDLYHDFGYILFHSFESAVIVLTGNPELQWLQSALITLNLWLPVAIYVVAKRYFVNLDSRIPALSVICYSVLSNFSYIYFTQLKTTGVGGTEISLLSITADKTYNGTMNFLQPLYFFAPMAVAMVIFVTILFLMKINSIKKHQFIPLMTVLVFSAYLVHVVEAFIIAVIVIVYSLLHKNNGFRQKDTLISIILGFASATGFLVFETFVWPLGIRHPGIPVFSFAATILPMILCAMALVWHSKVLPALKITLPKYNGEKIRTSASIVLLSVYTLGLVTSIFIENFKTSSVVDFGSVPWFIYPSLLGMAGFLAILCIAQPRSVLRNNSLIFALQAIVVLFVMGRILTAINLNVGPTGYWEKRFINYIFLFACLVAPIPIVRFIQAMSIQRKLIYRAVSLIAISAIVVSGSSSLLLQSEFWLWASPNAPSGQELEAVNYLREVFVKDPRAFILTPTSYSRDVLAFAAPPYQVTVTDPFFSAENPGIPLFMLDSHGLKHAYIYVNTRDIKFLNDHCGWVCQHLLPELPIVFSNAETKIYNATYVGFPTPSSSTALVLSNDPGFRKSSYGAYDLLAQTNAEYTTMEESDHNLLNESNLMLGYDPISYTEFRSQFRSSDWNVQSGNWNFDGNNLNAGENSNGTSRVILSPIAAKYFNASVAFKLTEKVPNVASYVSIIHSWKDVRNYDYSGILIEGNKVYVYFAHVKNGKLEFEPPWPSTDTGLLYRDGTSFNVTLATKPNLIELLLNGTKVLSKEGATQDGGLLGLSYGRVKSVSFDDFHGTVTTDSRPGYDYLKYAYSGGHLIVVNSNGYGDIGKALNIQAAKTESFNAKNSSAVNTTLGQGMNYYQNHDSSSTSIPMKTRLLTYSSPSGILSIPASTIKYGAGNITYVDVRSANSTLDTKTRSSDQSQHGSLSFFDATGLNQNQSDPNAYTPTAIFNQLNATGKITISTNSLILPAELSAQQLRVVANGTEVLLENASNIQFSGYNDTRVTTNSISLENGQDFYSEIESGNLDKFEFHGSAQITASYNDTSYTFSNVSSAQLNSSEHIIMKVRQPEIYINGQTTFRALNAQPTLSTSVTGQDLRVKGMTSLNIFMSDRYSIATAIHLNGTSQITPNPSGYNEITSLNLESTPYYHFLSASVIVRMLLLAPFILSLILLVRRNSNGRTSRQKVVL